MFKNQLQELAQRSCFNLPSYACIREGPDHAPRFKASVNFNGEVFESPNYSTTLRQAEHAAAEAALNSLSSRGPSKSLTARVLDETGVYKNLLQETAHRAGLKLPIYTTVRSGPGHVPVFTSTVELAGMSFSGEAAKTKKQAEKNAAIAAWSSLKRMPSLGPLSQTSKEMEQRRVNHNHHYHQRRDENRVIRRRDQYHQTRGRMQRPQRGDINNLNSFALKRPWKFMDTFSDPSSETSHVQNHNNFLSLLPPPPPRTAPKILPPNLIQSNTVKMAEPPLDDDNEWINKISEAIKNPPPPVEISTSSSHFYGGKSIHCNQTGGNGKGASNFDKISEAIKNPPPPVEISTSSLHFYGGKSIHCNQTGGNGKGASNLDFPKSSPQIPPFRVSSNCSFNAMQRIAPAVQIRSVIPVCAAPPPTKESLPSPPLLPPPAAATSAELASTLSKLKL